jgi:hypothetical protein
MVTGFSICAEAVFRKIQYLVNFNPVHPYLGLRQRAAAQWEENCHELYKLLTPALTDQTLSDYYHALIKCQII